jgi:hypothetical protein
MTEWISVKDRKPDQHQLCYVCNNQFGYHIFEAMYDKSCDIFCYITLGSEIPKMPIHVTHWIAKQIIPIVPVERE